jgi:16S rRNA (cytosine967-C5)-methyltransferase
MKRNPRAATPVTSKTQTVSSVPGAAVRAAAAHALDAVLHDGRSLKALLPEVLAEFDDVRDRALLEAICFHALRHRRRYEHALATWMPRPLPQREHLLRALLLAGLAQLDALALPAHAAVSVTAEAARLLGRQTHVALVNALLRRATREAWPQNAEPAITHSYPDWIVTRLRRDWPQDWQAILAAGNVIAPAWLRVNARMGSRAEYAERLHAIEMATTLPMFPAQALRLEQGIAAERLPGWNDGAISVQDGAAQLAAEALAPLAGERVLDACAAPGGKSAHLLELAPGIALTALDNDAARLARVGDTLRRLHLDDAVVLRCADAVELDRWWDGATFDAVLLDAPCSATGIIRRQPDIKWHRRESDIGALAAQQDRLLDALWRVVRPGGRLLYATCSILNEENAQRIDAFLARTVDAEAQPLDARYGRESGAGRQKLPGDDGMDGFFYALLRKAPIGE